METHVRVIGWLYIIMGVVSIGLVLLAGLFLGVIGVASGDDEAAVWMVIFGVFFGCCGLVLSVPGIIAGFGLLKFRNWARILTIILSMLNLISFPLGTALGIYGLVILFNEEAQELFE